MLVEEKYENIHYIEYFDTIIRKNNFGRLMMRKYYEYFESVELIPREIIESSAEYWVKVLDFYYEDDNDKKCIKKGEIDTYIKDLNLNPNDLSWQYLYNLERRI